MPNLGLHIGFALEARDRFRHPLLDEHLGSYLLGCTTPDIRLFAGWDRERTHFFRLASDPAGTGFERLVREHPQLRKSERLNRETRAFLLGYMSHLSCDEVWIVNVWRRYFGRGGPLGDDPLSAVLDRAFQFELDRRERASISDLEGALERIEGAYEGVDVGFIDPALLREWQAIVVSRSGREMPWTRFRGFVRRVCPNTSDGEVEAILHQVPALLERVASHIREEEVRAFRETAIQAFLDTARHYLREGQVN